MKKPRDKYSKAIRYLRAHPDEIFHAWMSPLKHHAGCLFYFASKSGDYVHDIGCLTMLSKKYNKNLKVENSPELTEAIREDKSIQDLSSSTVGVSHLKRFAYWQRKIDKKLGRNI